MNSEKETTMSNDTPEYDTGGAAFPRPCGRNDDMNSDARLGMTLLDWFAGQAIAPVIGLVTAPGTKRANGGTITEPDIANTAYAIAAAMIAEKRRLESGR